MKIEDYYLFFFSCAYLMFLIPGSLQQHIEGQEAMGVNWNESFRLGLGG